MRNKKPLISLALGLSLATAAVLALSRTPAARAAGPTCEVGPSGLVDYTTIGAAIADKGCTTIRLAAAVYYEHLTIDRAVTIQGPRIGSAVIDGSGISRVLYVDPKGNVTLKDVYVAHGNSSLGGGIRNEGALHLDHATVRDNSAPVSIGGGIYNVGTLTIENSSTIYNNVAKQGGGIYSSGGDVVVSDSTLISNMAVGEKGGGIYSYDGPLAISDSDVVSNTAAYDGGGVCHQGGALTIEGSTIVSNTAGNWHNGGGVRSYDGWLTIRDSAITANTAGSGGGVHASAGGTLVIENTTIRGNQAVAPSNAYGGGVYNDCDTATLTNVAISGNSAGKTGGGIHNLEALTVTNVTVSGNAAPYGGGVGNTGSQTLLVRNSTIVSNTVAGDIGPGGIQNYGTAVFANTVLAHNENANCASSVTLTSSGYNLDSGSTCGFGAAGDLSNTDPDLDPLQDNGGDTLTHALLEGSLAIDRGGTCPPTDQRGIPRFGPCDVGAYEYEQWIYVYLPLVLRIYPAP